MTNNGTTSLPWVKDDGGRSKYFKAEKVGDCVTRAIAIASGRDYKEVYDELFDIAKSSPRDGVKKAAIKKYMTRHGYQWVALMRIGSGTTHHLRRGELPERGSIICSCSGHLVAIIDGVVHDTYDPTRAGGRAVYGYWIVKPAGGDDNVQGGKPAQDAQTIPNFDELPNSVTLERPTGELEEYKLHVDFGGGDYFGEYLCCENNIHALLFASIRRAGREEFREAMLAKLNGCVARWNEDIKRGHLTAVRGNDKPAFEPLKALPTKFIVRETHREATGWITTSKVYTLKSCQQDNGCPRLWYEDELGVKHFSSGLFDHYDEQERRAHLLEALNLDFKYMHEYNYKHYLDGIYKVTPKFG